MTPTVLPLWLEFIKAVAPLLAALLAAGVGAWVAHKFGRIQEGIARQQATTAAAAAATAKSKLKLELFERRIAVYEAVNYALHARGWAQSTPYQRETELKERIHGARWIYDDAVFDYLSNELVPLFEQETVLIDDLDRLFGSADSPEAMENRRCIDEDMWKQYARVEEVFGPHLRLED